MEIKKADIRDVERAIAAIDRIEARRGEDFEDYEFDAISAARSQMWEWVAEATKEA